MASAIVPTKPQVLSLFRQLYRGLRENIKRAALLEKDGTRIHTTPTWKYIREFGKIEGTEETIKLYRLGESYLTYLQSTRKHQDIVADYKGKGERSTQETANIMGFKLPHEARVEKVKTKSN